MFAYKVLDKKTRYGSNALIYIDIWGYFIFTRLLAETPALKEFFPVYKDKAIVKAVDGTDGIFCFRTTKSAKAFGSKYVPDNAYCIVKVKGIGNVKTYVRPLTGIGSSPADLVKVHKKNMKYEKYTKAIPGCITFPSVEVIEEYKPKERKEKRNDRTSGTV